MCSHHDWLPLTAVCAHLLSESESRSLLTEAVSALSRECAVRRLPGSSGDSAETGDTSAGCSVRPETAANMAAKSAGLSDGSDSFVSSVGAGVMPWGCAGAARNGGCCGGGGSGAGGLTSGEAKALAGGSVARLLLTAACISCWHREPCFGSRSEGDTSMAASALWLCRMAQGAADCRTGCSGCGGAEC